MDQAGLIEAGNKTLLTSRNFAKEGYASFSLFGDTKYSGRMLLKRNRSGQGPKSGRYIPRKQKLNHTTVTSAHMDSNHI